MKLLCDRMQLLDAFAVAVAIAPQKTTKPIFKTTFLSAQDGRVITLTTDGEISAKVQLDSVKIKEAGEVLLPTREAHALLREIVDPTITLEAAAQKCQLLSGSGSFMLVSEDPDQFPRDLPMPEGELVRVEARVLLDMVRKTMFAAAKEESRYAISGVLFDVKDGSLRLAATDGRRLAMCYSNLDGNAAEISGVVPLRALLALTRAIPESNDTIEIVIGSKQIAFRSSHGREMTLISQLLDVKFPDYETAIPRAADTTVEISRSLLESNLRRVAVLCGGDIKIVRFRLSSSALEMSTESAGIGRADLVMELDVKGAGGSIGFNPDFVLEALRTTDVETVRMDMTDEETPAKFSLGESFVYVLMPITGG